jgi:hypothetical protein
VLVHIIQVHALRPPSVHPTPPTHRPSVWTTLPIGTRAPSASSTIYAAAWARRPLEAVPSKLAMPFAELVGSGAMPVSADGSVDRSSGTVAIAGGHRTMRAERRRDR